MSSEQTEQVMVVPRTAFDRLGSFQGLNFDVNHYWQLLDRATFMERAAAEEDPNFKQIIPYQIVTRGFEILHYARLKGEKRLASKRSIGVGGHINSDDVSRLELQAAGYMGQVYIEAAQRELSEELKIASPVVTNRAAGWLNDDSNAVGRVHLGLVHIVAIDGIGGVSYGSEEDRHIELIGFQRHREIRSHESPAPLEPWSEICLNNFADLETNPKGRAF